MGKGLQYIPDYAYTDHVICSLPIRLFSGTAATQQGTLSPYARMYTQTKSRTTGRILQKVIERCRFSLGLTF
jgi:hypothetical protein